jgi:hypothetical protein
MARVENIRNLSNSYYKVTRNHGDRFKYLVPFPFGLTSTTKAHWTTDVIVLDPSCSWQPATTTEPVNLSWNVMLPESNLGISLRNDSLGMFSFPPMFSSIYSISVSSNGNTQLSTFTLCNKSATEFPVPVDGSVLFAIDQLNLPEPHGYPDTMSVDLSSIPTLKLPTGNALAFLLCSPHISIQTRQVWAIGNGNLDLGKPQPSQGNIDLLQANYILSLILFDLPTMSGPTSVFDQVGTDLMVRLIFGNDVAYPHDNMPPAPLTNITAAYTQIINSAMNTFFSNPIATVNVPGGHTEEQMVFTSSLGHIITSAILFAFLRAQENCRGTSVPSVQWRALA